MNRFLGLLRKDWLVSKNTIFIIFWITLAGYLFVLGAYFYAYFKNGYTLNNIFRMMYQASSLPQLNMALVFTTNLLSIVNPGLLALVIIGQLSSTALNNDAQRNCEIFYRAQPVPLWWISGSKMIISLFGPMAALLALGVFNFIVLNSVLYSVFGTLHINVAMAGILLGWCEFFLVGFVISGLFCIFSAIFKDWAFGKGLGLMVLISLLIELVNHLFLLAIPKPTDLIVHLLKGGFDGMGDVNLNTADEGVYGMINFLWRSIFSWYGLEKIGAGLAMYGLATWLYSRKEIK